MLRGKRIVLRAIEPERLPNHVRWLADPDVLMYFGPFAQHLSARVLGK